MQQRCKALCIGKAPNWDCLQVLQQPHALLQNLVFQMSSWKTNDHAGQEQSPNQLELDEALSLLEDHVIAALSCPALVSLQVSEQHFPYKEVPPWVFCKPCGVLTLQPAPMHPWILWHLDVRPTNKYILYKSMHTELRLCIPL